MFSTSPAPPNLPIQLTELKGEKLTPESFLRAVARPRSFYKDYHFPCLLTQVSHPFRGEAKEPPYGYDKARVFARTNRNGTENVSLRPGSPHQEAVPGVAREEPSERSGNL